MPTRPGEARFVSLMFRPRVLALRKGLYCSLSLLEDSGRVGLVLVPKSANILGHYEPSPRPPCHSRQDSQGTLHCDNLLHRHRHSRIVKMPNLSISCTNNCSSCVSPAQTRQTNTFQQTSQSPSPVPPGVQQLSSLKAQLSTTTTRRATITKLCAPERHQASIVNQRFATMMIKYDCLSSYAVDRFLEPFMGSARQ